MQYLIVIHSSGGDYNGQPLAKIQTKLEILETFGHLIDLRNLKFVTDISMSLQLLSVADRFDVYVRVV